MCRYSDFPPYEQGGGLVSTYGKVSHVLARRDGYLVTAQHDSDQNVVDVVTNDEFLVRAWRLKAQHDDMPLPTFIANATVYITSHVDDRGEYWRVLDFNRAAEMLDPLHGHWDTEENLLRSLAERYVDVLAEARDARREDERRSN